MKRNVLVLAVLAGLVAAAPVSAQDLAQPVCPNGSSVIDPQRIAQDGCQQAYDLYRFMAPQLGLALAGGNAILGSGSTLGGLGHLSVGIRANAFSGLLPDVTNFHQSSAGAQKNAALPTKDQFLGLPTADAAIGIFGGIPLPLTHVGGVDALVSAAYVPTVTAGSFSITPSSNLQIGYGARVGLLQESLVVPGVSVTFLKRDLPETSLSGTAGSNTLTVSKFKVETTAWRVTASKSFILFSLAAGAGQDKYDQSAAAITGTVSGVTASVPANQLTIPTMTRTNYFADAALDLPLFKVVGELGQVSGGTVQTYNGFAGGRGDRSQVYFSVGLRLGW